MFRADTAALAGFLQAYPANRYRGRAAELLLEGHLAAKADVVAIVEAARLYLEAVPEKIRPEAGLSLVRQMAAEPPDQASARQIFSHPSG
jgi:hypothetical protein